MHRRTRHHRIAEAKCTQAKAVTEIVGLRIRSGVRDISWTPRGNRGAEICSNPDKLTRHSVCWMDRVLNIIAAGRVIRLHLVTSSSKISAIVKEQPAPFCKISAMKLMGLIALLAASDFRR